MAFESLTDDKISDLLNCAKRCTNPRTRSKNKDGHEQVNYKVAALDGTDHEFELYTRQNLRDGMEDDFSCGISWIAPNGESLTLKRYNGPAHYHTNRLEKERKDITPLKELYAVWWGIARFPVFKLRLIRQIR